MGDKRYTYADYVTWTGDERWELIDGVPYMMASPHSNHQRIVTRLAGRLDATKQRVAACSAATRCKRSGLATLFTWSEPTPSSSTCRRPKDSERIRSC